MSFFVYGRNRCKPVCGLVRRLMRVVCAAHQDTMAWSNNPLMVVRRFDLRRVDHSYPPNSSTKNSKRNSSTAPKTNHKSVIQGVLLLMGYEQ
jgi:hypothetical protein